MHHATSRPGQGDGIGAAADAADQQEGTETWPVAMAMPTLFFLKRAGELCINVLRRRKKGGEPPEQKVTNLEGLEHTLENSKKPTP